jgi:hypothetical protein
LDSGCRVQSFRETHRYPAWVERACKESAWRLGGDFLQGQTSQIETFMRMLDYKGQKGDQLSAYVESVKVYWKDEKGYKGPWMKCRKFEI